MILLSLWACSLSPLGPEASSSPRSELELTERYTGGAEVGDPSVPVVLALHGLGDRPERFIGLFQGWEQPARVLAPAGWDERAGGGYSWFPLSAAETPDTLHPAVESSARALAEALRELGLRPEQEIWLTGFSQGGMLSYALAMTDPELFDRILPVGGFPTGTPPPDLELPPIHAFHGGADQRIPVEWEEQGIQRWREQGYAVELTIWPRLGHSISEDMRQAILRRLPQPEEEE